MYAPVSLMRVRGEVVSVEAVGNAVKAAAAAAAVAVARRGGE